jgi:hypothetical protein
MEINLHTIIFWQVITNLVSFIILGIVIIAFLKYRIKADRNSLSLHPEKSNKRKFRKFFAVRQRKKEKQKKPAKLKLRKIT